MRRGGSRRISPSRLTCGFTALILQLALVETHERDVANDSFLMQVRDYQTGNQFIYYFGRCRGAESRTEEFMDKLVLGAAALALSAGAASPQALYPSNGYGPYGYGYRAPAPLYDYAGPASATPHGYGPLITHHNSTHRLLLFLRRRRSPA